MKLLGKRNRKLKKTADKLGVRIFNWSIPAYKSKTGRFTCPFAKDCVKYCYAQKGAYAWSNTKEALEKRYEASKADDFVDQIVEEIGKIRDDGRQIYIRVHDSGDFYSKSYLWKWIEIAERLPHVRFYGYTKSHDLLRDYSTPENMNFVFSLGSTIDDKVNIDTERHARIFNTEEELVEAGYTNASEFDLYATKWYSPSNKVGLILH